MIYKNGLNDDPFWIAIASHFGDSRKKMPEPSIDDVIYLGGGFWRMGYSKEKDGYFLINPNVTKENIRAVERGISIMESLKFKDV